MFPAYAEYPKDSAFEGQDKDEQIILLLRAHPITNLPWIFLALFLILLPLFLPPVMGLVGVDMALIPPLYQLTYIIINYLAVLIIVFEGFLYWYFNVYILTNKRIYDIDFHSLLRRNIDLVPLQEIQETNSDLAGVLGMLFHYGNVYVQTAGAQISVDFLKVPNPSKVADMIMDQAGKEVKNAGN